jgi:hypothetical protein
MIVLKLLKSRWGTKFSESIKKLTLFQGSSLVKHFTKFTKDIFASLICLIFIFEAMVKILKVSHFLTKF